MVEPSWDLYRALLATLDAGSLSGAARALGLTQPTLGRQIAELEHLLGTALFARTPRGLRPTDAALSLAPHVRAMAGAAGALARTAAGAGEALAGAVRITASEIVGAELLPPMLRDLRLAHPGMTFELVLANDIKDLLSGEADIAVRMVRPSQSALVARRIGAVGIGLYAHRDYLARCGLPADRAALGDHALIGFDRDTPFLRRLAAELGLHRGEFALRVDSDLAQLAAVRAGFGIGFVQHGIARRDPALRAVLAEDIGFTLDLWLAMHEDLRGIARIRRVFDALAEALPRQLTQGGGR